jgi:hypothetical protein
MCASPGVVSWCLRCCQHRLMPAWCGWWMTSQMRWGGGTYQAAHCSRRCGHSSASSAANPRRSSDAWLHSCWQQLSTCRAGTAILVHREDGDSARQSMMHRHVLITGKYCQAHIVWAL